MSNVPSMGQPEGSVGTWSHCGNTEAHAAHHHTVTLNEGPYPGVWCLGTHPMKSYFPDIRPTVIHCGNEKPHAAHRYWGGTCRGTNAVGCISEINVRGRALKDLAAQYVDIIEKGESEVTSRVTRVSRINVLRARIASMEQELTELERFPSDRFEVGTAILFDKVYTDTEQLYHYAAVKATPT